MSKGFHFCEPQFFIRKPTSQCSKDSLRKTRGDPPHPACQRCRIRKGCGRPNTNPGVRIGSVLPARLRETLQDPFCSHLGATDL